MSIRSIAQMDFKSVRRSPALWFVAVILAMLGILIAFTYQGYLQSPRENVLGLFNRIVMILDVLLPIVVIVASYMAIAGERENGGIKFLLGFPNTRLDVFLGKLVSRATAVTGGVVLLFAGTASYASARFGTLPFEVLLPLLVLTVLYAAAFVAVAVSLSALAASRSRAIGAAVGAYFVLVILYFLPGIEVPSLVRWLHHGVLGNEPDPFLYAAVSYVSPMRSYQAARDIVFPEAFHNDIFGSIPPEAGPHPWFLQDEIALFILLAWIVLPTVGGYLKFRRTDLK